MTWLPRRRATLALVSLVALLASALPARAHGFLELIVARTAASKLVPYADLADTILVPRSLFTGFPGYATASIGFENIPLSDPPQDAYVLVPQSNISVRFVGIDPGVSVHDGFTPLNVGDSMALGQPDFDRHPIFSINPAATPGQTFQVRLILTDASGTYSDSDEFTISITPACPADINLSDSVSVQDIFDFLSAYFQGSLVADMNSSGTLSVQDIFDFLSAYFTPCP